MTYDLILGDRAYSSWSLRGWLMSERFGLPVRQRFTAFSDPTSVADQIAAPPAKTVPTLITPDGAVIGESLAIAEELASRHPEAGLWPADPLARATARTLAAEMHAGFAALRTHCPMNLRCAYSDYAPPPDVEADLRRLELIWDHARSVCTPGGPWLCGEYSVADVFFAPVAARIAGYGLSVSDAARTYVDAHLADPAFRRWRAMSLVSGPDLDRYARDHAQTMWPGPARRPATPSDGPSLNKACPYSGDPVTHFLERDGRVWGFCNAFCRDKTLADPEAWPAFADMLRAH